MDPRNLARLGELLYGPRYVRLLADGLTAVGPRTVYEPHLSAWIRGGRPVPSWVAGQARALLPVGLAGLHLRVAALTDAALDPGFFDAAEPPAEADDDLGPSP